MSDFGSVVAHVIGLPKGTSLGDLEGLILPRINGRIVAIGLQDEGTANIEFARMADADACLGDHKLKGGNVKVFLPEDPTKTKVTAPPASSTKRTRSGAHPTPPPEVSVGIEPSMSGSSSSSSSASSVTKGFAAALSGAVLQPPVAQSMVDSPTSAALLAAAAASPGSMMIDSFGLTEDQARQAAAMAAAGAAAAKGAPAAKRQKSQESKEEKERRLNRVGLSYRCGRCGLPKKGHVCTMEGVEDEVPPKNKKAAAKAAAAAAIAAEQAAAAAGGVAPAYPPPQQPKPKAAKGNKKGQALDADSIFSDIKHVLTTPVGGTAAAANGSAKKNKRKKGDDLSEMPPPPPVLDEKAAAKSALLEELDIAMQRPPSLITPEDGTGAPFPAPLSTGAPSSVLSASDMFSPGQLMTHLLGTPTPAITPGLSPGTLNELGNMLQSPGAVLASANAKASTGNSSEPAKSSPLAASALAASLETPGQS